VAVTVRLPEVLRRFAGGAAAVRVDGADVRAVLDALDRAHPGLDAKLRDGDGNLRRFVELYAEGADVRFLDHLDTRLVDGAVLEIVRARGGDA
jgi:sulfur-carrier protein